MAVWAATEGLLDLTGDAVALCPRLRRRRPRGRAVTVLAELTPRGVDPGRRRRLGRRAQLLAGTSVAYNAVEAVIAITAGVVAGSVALVGFGLDSVVEVSSGLIILWQFRHPLPQSRERSCPAADGVVLLRAGRLRDVRVGARARDRARPGRLDRRHRVGGWSRSSSCRSCRGHNDAPAASSAPAPWSQTRPRRCCAPTCRAVLLGGLVLNATLGWSWADPLAGLVIAGSRRQGGPGRVAW